MTEPGLSLWQRLRKGRVRILWLVLGALLLVSALPIGLYHRQVLQLSQDKLSDNERVQQSDLTRSLAQEIQLFEFNQTSPKSPGSSRTLSTATATPFFI
jgi:hypothetical protein